MEIVAGALRVLIVMVLAAGVHEAGHAFAGRLVGFRFGLLAVGPLCIARSGERIALRWLGPKLWGPFALSYPVTAERITPRYAWYVAGGPIASLLLAAFGAALTSLIPPSLAHSYAASLSLASAGFFVATIQPFGTGAGVPTDGGRLWAVLRDKDAARQDAALFALEGLTEAGIRPRDWDRSLVALAGEVNTPPAYKLSSATSMLRLAEDTEDMDSARMQIDRIRAVYPRIPRWLRADAAVETAFWLAHFQKDALAARPYLRDARGPLVALHRKLRAEAAVRLGSGEEEGAREALEQANAALGTGPSPASPLDVELLQAVGRDLRRSAISCF